MSKKKNEDYINKFSEILKISFDKNYKKINKILKLIHSIKKKKTKLLFLAMVVVLLLQIMLQ